MTSARNLLAKKSYDRLLLRLASICYCQTRFSQREIDAFGSYWNGLWMFWDLCVAIRAGATLAHS